MINQELLETVCCFSANSELTVVFEAKELFDYKKESFDTRKEAFEKAISDLNGYDE